MPRLLSALTLGVLALFPARASESAPDPWQTALAFDYNAAAERFSRLYAATPADTRVAVAYASVLLVKQPRTETNILTARDVLLKVRETAAAPSDDSILALYLIARIELDHLDPAQPDSARTRLEQLRRDHPSHVLADHAAVELAYLAAYPPAGPAPAAIPSIEALLASVKAPGAARDLNQLLGSLQLRQLNKPAAALPHFIAARTIGFEQPLRNAESDITIANLARETGDPALARRYYEAFITAAPRDVRTSTVRRILASLDTTPSSSVR
jgi:hypothetical protein